MRLAIIITLLISVSVKMSGQKVFGYVREAATGESIPGAIVVSGGKATLANEYGYFSTEATSAADTIFFVATGYKTEKRTANDCQNGRLDVAMSLLSADIEEVTVVSQSTFRTELAMAKLSKHSIGQIDIKNNAVMFGEADAFKTLQCLPGVASAADGSVNLSVRGSSHDQNMILIDEATVYNPSHAIGLFSAFNPDAIQRIDFYKSGYSPRFGGKLAAVADIRMKEGNNQAFAMEGSAGTIGSRLLIETPVVKGIGSVMLAARMGYGDLVNTVVDFVDDGYKHADDVMRFYDVCFKTNWNISPYNKIFASAYTSHDEFKCSILSQDNVQEWGNMTGTLRWNHIFSQSLFSNFTLTYSNYDYLQQREMDVRDYEWKAGMREATFKADFDHYRGAHHVTFGLDLGGHFYNPGQIDPLNSASIMEPRHMKKRHMFAMAAYANDEVKVGDKLNIAAGLRLSCAMNGSAYAGIEPRLSAAYALSANLFAKASYARTMQFDHVLTNSALGMPTDIWMPISKAVKPQRANTVAAGLQSIIDPAGIELSCELYYKRMRKTIDYKDNADLHMNEDVESEIKEGEGRAYGLETMAKYSNRLLSAQASYTLSNAERRADEINGGSWYYAAYDQRHNLSVNATLHAGKRDDISLAFKYHTGGRATMPYDTYMYDGVLMALYTERNGYKKPDFHRLDVSWCHTLKSTHRWKSQIIVALYNCYGRKNAYSVFIKGDRYDLSDAKGHILYLYRWVPSVTYSFKF